MRGSDMPSDREGGAGRSTRESGALPPAAPPRIIGDTGSADQPTELAETVLAGAPVIRPLSPAPSHSPTPGERVGEDNRFEIVEKLATGGMSHMFRAKDWHLDR